MCRVTHPTLRTAKTSTSRRAPTSSCTIVNVLDMSIVTAGACTFDRMSANRAGFQFPLIFTPDGGSSTS